MFWRAAKDGAVARGRGARATADCAHALVALWCGGRRCWCGVVECADALKMRCLLVAAAVSERANWCVLFGTVSRIDQRTRFSAVEKKCAIP